MVGIIYCSKSRIDYKKIVDMLNQNGIKAKGIPMEEMNHMSQFDTVIHMTDCYYAKESIAKLITYFHSGGHIITLGVKPFTEDITSGEKNNRVLRAFGVIDDYIPLREGNYQVCDSYNNITKSMYLTGLHSAVYHLCTEEMRNGRLEHIVDAYDQEGELQATPVIRVVSEEKGSMTLFHFDLDERTLQDEFWKNIFVQAVRRELIGSIDFDIYSQYAMYRPDEPVTLLLSCKSQNARLQNPLRLHMQIHDEEEQEIKEYEYIIEMPYEQSICIELLKSSLYKVTARIMHKDVILQEITTGFLVIRDQEMEQEMKAFHPLYIEEEESGDYCLCDGEIAPILGTTYFVTDVHRECFCRLNSYLCSEELKKLSKDGYNVVRSGFWKHYEVLYNLDGTISELGIRALKTFFILAARNGLTVQFVLGNLMLNQWDVEKSAIHNMQMREKGLRFIQSFAVAFSAFANVTMDIVNEPSYSINGAWLLARPSYEEEERIRFQEWLQKKYQSISLLQKIWGELPSSIGSFSDIDLPDEVLFSRSYCRTEQRYNHTILADFYEFARNEFSIWVKTIRDTVKQYAPNMLVVMGRDETLRIPSQQDEVINGNLDMVCWHQWHYNQAVFIEYLLNRVRGKICVAQELGVYQFDDLTSRKRFVESEILEKAEHKILSAFGNFVQWQAYHDPFMYELSENSLGLYRADLTPTPSAYMMRKLMACEKQGAHYMKHREDDKIKILSLYSTSYHFSVDSGFIQSGLRQHINVLYNLLGEQTNLVLEHLFERKNEGMIGTPKLIILPAMQVLTKAAWEQIIAFLKEGGTVLVNGVIDKNEFFAFHPKISAIDRSYAIRKMIGFETLEIDGKLYSLDFRNVFRYADPDNFLDCGDCEEIKEYTIGKGTLLHCPYPIELSSNQEAILALYRYAMEKACAQNDIYKIIKRAESVLFTAISYEECTVYTVLNDGKEQLVEWIDLCSNTHIAIEIPRLRGYKVWISREGKILSEYKGW